MSVATRRALYGKLAGDATLSGLLGPAADGYTKAIYYEIAPPKAPFPYIVFMKSAGTPTYALKNKAMDSEMWLVKAVDHSESADAVDTIASRLDALLTDGVLSIAGKTQLYLRRESDVDYPELDEGEIYRHAGSTFRLVLT